MIKLETLIEHVDKAFDRSENSVHWRNEQGAVDGVVDIPEAYTWWNSFMKPELLRVFKENAKDEPADKRIRETIKQREWDKNKARILKGR